MKINDLLQKNLMIMDLQATESALRRWKAYPL